MSGNTIEIEPTGSNDTGVCTCCGRSSRHVWGLARTNGRCLAAYFVHWTLGHLTDRGANVDLILGEWGEGAGPEVRSALSLAYRLTDTGPSLMIIDAQSRPVARSALVGRTLRREEVLGSDLADDAFSIADAILAQDERVAELLGPWQVRA